MKTFKTNLTVIAGSLFFFPACLPMDLAELNDLGNISKNAICDPFGKPDHPSPDNQHGVAGSIYNIRKDDFDDNKDEKSCDKDNPNWDHRDDQSSWDDYDHHKHMGHGGEGQLDATIYLSEIFVPTQAFTSGFHFMDGSLLKTADGSPVLNNYALHLETLIKLGPNDSEGDYQFATISSDGSVVYFAVDENGNEKDRDDHNDVDFKSWINNDGVHSSKMACVHRTIRLTKDSILPMRFDYFQGSRDHMAMILMWRKVGSSSGSCGDDHQSDVQDRHQDLGNSDSNGEDSSHDLNDPLCEKEGDDLFFNSNTTPSTSEQAWMDLLSRGWSFLEPENYNLLPAYAPNPCMTPAPSPSPSPTPSVAPSSSPTASPSPSPMPSSSPTPVASPSPTASPSPSPMPSSSPTPVASPSPTASPSPSPSPVIPGGGILGS